MGVITIEVPQKVKKQYRITSDAEGEAVIDGVEKLMKDADKTVKRQGRRKRISLQDIVGIWAYRSESTEEIARRLRNGWKRGRD